MKNIKIKYWQTKIKEYNINIGVINLQVYDISITANQINILKATIGFKWEEVKGTKHRRFKMTKNQYNTIGTNKNFDYLLSVGLIEAEVNNAAYYNNSITYKITTSGIKLLSYITGTEIIN